jgi:hypothetical protein
MNTARVTRRWSILVCALITLTFVAVPFEREASTQHRPPHPSPSNLRRIPPNSSSPYLSQQRSQTVRSMHIAWCSLPSSMCAWW